MAHYPPHPPPEQDYETMYSTATGAQQLVDAQGQFQFSAMNQVAYPKVESAPNGQTPSSNSTHTFIHHIPPQDTFNTQQSAQHASQLAVQPQLAGASADPQAALDQSQKINRLRKACDGCSIRKVKCDETGPPCRPCAALNIPCTWSRPVRRRGPPNRHAEAIKRARVESFADPSFFDRESSPASPTHAAQALAALSSHAHKPSAESICSISKLNPLIDDFFTYIHPLYPFPHEPSFREAWKRREDLSNAAFLSLLASMVAALVSSFPRKPRIHLTARRRDANFPKDLDLVTRCQKVCLVARGPGFLDSDTLSVYDAATSYFLGLTGLHTHRWRQSRLYFGECLTILRALGLHKEQDQSYTILGSLPSALGSYGIKAQGTRGQQIDNITLEMSRRLFWTIFSTVRSMQQLGADFDELIIPPSTPSQPYPPLPAEVDDFCVFPTHNEPQPAGYLPFTAAFNANVKCFRAYDALASIDMAWGKNSVNERERQIGLLVEALRKCSEPVQILSQRAHEELPNDLSSSNGAGHSGQNMGSQPHFPRDPASSLQGESLPSDDQEAAKQRRHLQHAIQKNNLYASALSTRMYILKRLQALSKVDGLADVSVGRGELAPGLEAADPGSARSRAIEEIMRVEETKNLIGAVLGTLANIETVNVEPNADNFVAKLRTLAAMLVDLLEEPESDLAKRLRDSVTGFLRSLLRLEGEASGGEEAESGIWDELLLHKSQLAEIAASFRV